MVFITQLEPVVVNPSEAVYTGRQIAVGNTFIV
jgi:hypothetical protein